jgi:hypothetical protein
MTVVVSRPLQKAIYLDKQYEKGYFIVNGERNEKTLQGGYYVEDVDGGSTCCIGPDADILSREQ